MIARERSRNGAGPVLAMRAARALPIVLSCAWLAACGSERQGGPNDEVAPRAEGPVNDGAGSAGGLTVPVPDALLASRAIDPGALELTVRVDGMPVEAIRQDGRWVLSLTDTRGEPVTLELEWSERFRGNALPLATLEREIDTSEPGASVHIDAEEYVTDGFDRDEDGYSNLEERRNGSDPEDDGDPGADVVVDVRVPAIDPADAPVINGSYGQLWNPAAAVDVAGEPLAIDRLLIDEANVAAGPLPGYRWYAMHDGEWLYLFVTFGNQGGRMPSKDSEALADDDTLNLYVDGDHGRAAMLDDEDRYLALPGRIGDGMPRLPAVAPAVAAPFVPPGLEYGFCLCPDGVGGWELKVPLAELGITVGHPFGLELQVDQDIDGGARDARWGWSNPSLGEQGADYRADSPALNGTLVLDAVEGERVRLGNRGR